MHTLLTKIVKESYLIVNNKGLVFPFLISGQEMCFFFTWPNNARKCLFPIIKQAIYKHCGCPIYLLVFYNNNYDATFLKGAYNGNVIKIITHIGGLANL